MREVSARLEEGDWLPICHPWGVREVREEGEHKGEAQEHLCDQPPKVRVLLGGWKFWPKA